MKLLVAKFNDSIKTLVMFHMNVHINVHLKMYMNVYKSNHMNFNINVHVEMNIHINIDERKTSIATKCSYKWPY